MIYVTKTQTFQIMSYCVMNGLQEQGKYGENGIIFSQESSNIWWVTEKWFHSKHPAEAVTRSSSVKKMLLKISQNWQESIYGEVSFK